MFKCLLYRYVSILFLFKAPSTKIMITFIVIIIMSNTIYTVWQLVDTCVKNSGDQFVREVASREFMDQLTSMARSPVILYTQKKEEKKWRGGKKVDIQNSGGDKQWEEGVICIKENQKSSYIQLSSSPCYYNRRGVIQTLRIRFCQSSKHGVLQQKGIQRWHISQIHIDYCKLKVMFSLQ